MKEALLLITTLGYALACQSFTILSLNNLPYNYEEASFAFFGIDVWNVWDYNPDCSTL